MPEVLDRETIKAISTDTRQDIMKMLAKRPYTASEISKVTGKHVTTVTEHLDVLERSGLIRKRDSTNKWVYYELTDKGEHLFKPQFYSWVIVFSISVVFIFVGMLRMFAGSLYSGSASQDAQLLMERMTDTAIENATNLSVVSSPMLGQEAMKTAEQAGVLPIDYIGIGLIVLGLIGLGYLIYRKYKRK